jgi:hypothetical protein
MTVNWGIGSKNMVNLQSQIREFADKKTAYNEVHLYLKISLKIGDPYPYEILKNYTCRPFRAKICTTFFVLPIPEL